jgi:plasmid stabilization system protein ParE
VKRAVTIRPRAKADLQQAHEWYEEQCPGLGDEFLADMAESFVRLEDDPERFPVYYRSFRRVLAHRFPYKIFYRMAESDIIVVRILHGAQNHPRKLRR